MSRTEPAAVFAALGDPVRLALVDAVGQGARSISDLADGLPISRQGVTKHLRVLERAGLLQSAREGREVVWSADPGGLSVAQAHLDRVARGWDDVLARLKAHVEGG